MSHPELTATPLTADLLRGATDVERTRRGLLPHRLPAWARAQVPDDQLAMAESQPAGVRLALRTTARVLELDTIPTKRVYAGAPPRPDGVYDVLVDGLLVAQRSISGGDTLTIDLATGAFTTAEGGPGTLRVDDLPLGEKDVEIWLPHDETTELVAVRADAGLRPVHDTGRRVWLHHGSSISHGSNATHPTGTWPAVAALRAGVEVTNLGFGGGGMLDAFTARAMRDTPADLVSVKIGINLVNADLMRLRAFAPAVHGFLDTIREGHPDVPLVVVSPIWCPIHESTPGPAAPDMSALAEGRMAFVATGDPREVAQGRLTLEVIRAELGRIVAERSTLDPHLHYLDGTELYGESDHDARPLPDGLHPDAETHLEIGRRFADLALRSRVG